MPPQNKPKPSEIDRLVAEYSDRRLDEEADRQGVPRDFVRRIAGAESAGRPDVINGTTRSRAGAIGKMQLMPGTAKDLGVDPEDIDGNIRGGVQYAGQMLKRFGGDRAKAAAAYNAGPGAVEKYSGVPPYAETQDYVNKVAGGGEESEIDRLVKEFQQRQQAPAQTLAPEMAPIRPVQPKPPLRNPQRGPLVTPLQRQVQQAQANPFSFTQPTGFEAQAAQAQQRTAQISPDVAARADAAGRELTRFQNRSRAGQAAEVMTQGVLRGAEQVARTLSYINPNPTAHAYRGQSLLTPAAQQNLQAQEAAADVALPNTAPIARGVTSAAVQAPLFAGAGQLGTAGAVAAGAGMAAANEDWSDPKKAALRTAIGAVAPIAGARIAQNAIRPATMGGRLASGTVGGALGNVLPEASAQIITEGRLDPQRLGQQAVIGGITGAATPPGNYEAPRVMAERPQPMTRLTESVVDPTATPRDGYRPLQSQGGRVPMTGQPQQTQVTRLPRGEEYARLTAEQPAPKADAPAAPQGEAPAQAKGPGGLRFVQEGERLRASEKKNNVKWIDFENEDGTLTAKRVYVPDGMTPSQAKRLLTAQPKAEAPAQAGEPGTEPLTYPGEARPVKENPRGRTIQAAREIELQSRAEADAALQEGRFDDARRALISRLDALRQQKNNVAVKTPGAAKVHAELGRKIFDAQEEIKALKEQARRTPGRAPQRPAAPQARPVQADAPTRDITEPLTPDAPQTARLGVRDVPTTPEMSRPAEKAASGRERIQYRTQDGPQSIELDADLAARWREMDEESASVRDRQEIRNRQDYSPAINQGYERTQRRREIAEIQGDRDARRDVDLMRKIEVDSRDNRVIRLNEDLAREWRREKARLYAGETFLTKQQAKQWAEIRDSIERRQADRDAQSGWKEAPIAEGRERIRYSEGKNKQAREVDLDADLAAKWREADAEARQNRSVQGGFARKKQREAILAEQARRDAPPAESPRPRPATGPVEDPTNRLREADYPGGELRPTAGLRVQGQDAEIPAERMQENTNRLRGAEYAGGEVRRGATGPVGGVPVEMPARRGKAPAPERPAGRFRPGTVENRFGPSTMSAAFPSARRGLRFEGENVAKRIGAGEERGEYGKLASYVFKSTSGKIEQGGAHGQDSFLHDPDTKGALGLTRDAEMQEVSAALKADLTRLFGVESGDVSRTYFSPETLMRWADVRGLGQGAREKLRIAIEKYQRGVLDNDTPPPADTPDRSQPQPAPSDRERPAKAPSDFQRFRDANAKVIASLESISAAEAATPGGKRKFDAAANRLRKSAEQMGVDPSHADAIITDAQAEQMRQASIADRIAEDDAARRADEAPRPAEATPAPRAEEAPRFADGDRVEIAGAQFDVVRTNADGSITLRNDQGDTWEEAPSASWRKVDAPTKKGTASEAPEASRRDAYIEARQREQLETARAALAKARQAIQEHLQKAGVKLPVGISAEQYLAARVGEAKRPNKDLAALKRQLDAAQESVARAEKEMADTKGGMGSTRYTHGEVHRRMVESAIAKGKPVPAEVLADYPDLAPKAPDASAASEAKAADKWIETLDPASKERVFAEMRRIGEEIDRSYKRAKDLAPPSGTTGVGSSDFDPMLKAEALSTLLRGLRNGLSPDAALKEAKASAREIVAKWNEYGTKGRVTAGGRSTLERWEGTADTYLETAARRVSQAIAPKVPDAPPVAETRPRAVSETKAAPIATGDAPAPAPKAKRAAKAKPAAKERMQKFDPRKHIKLIADKPKDIRGSDVWRLFDQADEKDHQAIADYLTRVRPDLSRAVAEARAPEAKPVAQEQSAKAAPQEVAAGKIDGKDVTADEMAVYDAMAKVEPSFTDARAEAGLSKEAFDKAALSLADKEILTLHYHDFPQSLSPEGRAHLVQGPGGDFIAGALRTPRAKVEKAGESAKIVAPTQKEPGLPGLEDLRRGYERDAARKEKDDYENWSSREKEGALSPEESRRRAQIVAEGRHSILEPTQEENAAVTAKSRTQKEKPNIGLTPAQATYLQGKVGEVKPRLEVDGSRAVTIRVPDDGQFTVRTPGEADKLLERIGKPIVSMKRPAKITQPPADAKIPADLNENLNVEGTFPVDRVEAMRWGGNHTSSKTWATDGHLAIRVEGASPKQREALLKPPKIDGRRAPNAEGVESLIARETRNLTGEKGQTARLADRAVILRNDKNQYAIIEGDRGNPAIVDAQKLRLIQDSVSYDEIRIASEAPGSHPVGFFKAGELQALLMPMRIKGEEAASIVRMATGEPEAPSAKAKPARKPRRKQGASVGKLDDETAGGTTLGSGLGSLQALFDRKRPIPQGRDLDAWQDSIANAIPQDLPEDAINRLDAIVNRAMDAAEAGDRAGWNRYRDEAANMLLPKGMARVGAELSGAWNAARSIMASGDLSAPLRQGAILTLPPSQWGRAGRAAMRMFRSIQQEKYDRFVREMEQHPDYDAAMEAGLHISSSGKGEEDFTYNNSVIARLAQNAPILKQSERAYKSYLDSLRLDTFAKYKQVIENGGGTEAQKADAIKAAADWINIATGRGSLGKTFDEAVPLLSKIFFAPRYTASRIQVLNPATYAKNLRNPASRQVFRRQMGELFQAASVLAATGALAQLAGATVNVDDPDSPDWMKIKFGDTRYDPGAGLQQIARLSLRIGKYLKANATGTEAQKKAASDSASRAAVTFGRSKLAPVPSFFVDWLNNWTNVVGERHTPTEVSTKNPVVSRFLPLLWADMIDAYREGGAGKAARFTPGIFGVGVQDYDVNKKRKATASKPARPAMPRPKVRKFGET